jgi:hypothetical protein
LCTVVVIGGVVQLIGAASHLTGPPTLYDGIEALGWVLIIPLVFSILAALIIVRQPGNRVGWLMMIVALALNNPLGLLIQVPSAPPAVLSLGSWFILWLDGWSWIPVIFPIFLIPLFFPTGRPPSPRWSWVSTLAVLMWIVFLVITAFTRSFGPLDADWTVVNPVGFISEDVINGPFLIAWGIGLVAIVAGSVASLFVRYRRADSAERQQMKWLLLAGAVLVVDYALSFFLSDVGGFEESAWTNALFILSILGIPIAVGIAIFRYRLWDLDVVVNRALVYGLLTTLLAGIFAAVIASVTEAAKQLLGEQSRTLGAAVSALIVAVVFQPLRTWIEAGVNQRFYPEKIDLASGLVEVQPEYWGFLDLTTLIRITLDHVHRVLGTSHSAFFLADEGGEFRLAHEINGSANVMTSLRVTEKQRRELEKNRFVAAEGTDSIVGHVPVYVDRGKTNELLGLLSIGARQNGKGYSGDDLKGLAELGGKIGLALKAIQLGSTSK